MDWPTAFTIIFGIAGLVTVVIQIFNNNKFNQLDKRVSLLEAYNERDKEDKKTLKDYYEKIHNFLSGL